MRKPPIQHHVKTYEKSNGKKVQSYTRGNNQENKRTEIVITPLDNEEKRTRFVKMAKSGKIPLHKGVNTLDNEIIPLLYDLNSNGYIVDESRIAHTDQPLQQNPKITFKKRYTELQNLAEVYMKKQLPEGFKIINIRSTIEILPPGYNPKLQERRFHHLLNSNYKAGTPKYIREYNLLAKRVMREPERYGFVSNRNRKTANKIFINNLTRAVDELKAVDKRCHTGHEFNPL